MTKSELPIVGTRVSKWLAGYLKFPLALRIFLNLPSRKPQLWENLSTALIRRAIATFASLSDVTWTNKLHWTAIRPFGFAIWLRYSNQYIDRFLFTFNVFEIATTKLFLAALRPGMTVFDVGANGGYFSLLAAKLVGAKGKVVAFEPVPGILARLEVNIALNKMDWVFPYGLAVSDNNGDASLFVSPYRENDGVSSLVPPSAKNFAEIKIKTITLDSFVKDHQIADIHLLKIDVEGFEEEVLRGSESILRSKSPVVVFETYKPHAIVPWLERLGYTIRRLHYRLPEGLEFYEVGEAFEDLFLDYEAPNYVAIKTGSTVTFDELRRRGPLGPLWARILARWF